MTDMSEMIHLEHITKTYEGVEQSLRGTKLEWKGPALWLRNLAKAARLTSSVAPRSRRCAMSPSQCGQVKCSASSVPMAQARPR